MAHFAEIHLDNKVIQVLVVPNEQEHRGQDFCAIDLNLGGTWIQTSYNHNFGGKYAGIGDTYDAEKNEFFSPEPIGEEIIDVVKDVSQ
jgi:hypothetical protein